MSHDFMTTKETTATILHIAKNNVFTEEVARLNLVWSRFQGQHILRYRKRHAVLRATSRDLTQNTLSICKRKFMYASKALHEKKEDEDISKLVNLYLLRALCRV